MRLNVLPGFMIENVGDGSSGNSIFLNQKRSCGSKFEIFSDFLNFLICQFAHAVVFATIIRYSTATFLGTILLIRFVSSKENMIGSNALWSIATMANLFAFWYFPKMNFPRNAMRFPNIISTKSKCSICIFPFSMQSANPEPATIRFVNVFPEPLFWWDRRKTRSGCKVACLATILSASISGGSEDAFAF